MQIHTMERIAGEATALYGTTARMNDMTVLGNYAIVERTYFGFAVMVYAVQQYGCCPAWSIADGFETDEARDMWYAVRASLRRLRRAR